VSDLPAPLVPAGVDLRDFPFIPLQFRRLFSSETWILGSAEEKLAALCLWCESWHQVPAASLPDDQRMLAHLSQTGPRWSKVRGHALRGWIEASDGRLYHPVVAEKALDAWSKKQSQRKRTAAARAALHPVTGTVSESVTASVTDPATSPVTESVTESKRREVKGSEVKGNITPSPAARVPSPGKKLNGKSRRNTIPEDFSISDRVKTWAAEKGYDRLNEHLEVFIGKCRAKGYEYIDFDEALMNCIRDDWGSLRKSDRQVPDYSRVIATLEDGV
jgi:Protein of unknown function (DUF1376)